MPGVGGLSTTLLLYNNCSADIFALTWISRSLDSVWIFRIFFPGLQPKKKICIVDYSLLNVYVLCIYQFNSLVTPNKGRHTFFLVVGPLRL